MDSPMPDGGDRELVIRVAQGDDRAFEDLVHRYERYVLGIIRKVLRDPEDQDDAFQDTCVHVWRAIDRGMYRHDRPFRPYLAAVAYHVAVTV